MIRAVALLTAAAALCACSSTIEQPPGSPGTGPLIQLDGGSGGNADSSPGQGSPADGGTGGAHPVLDGSVEQADASSSTCTFESSNSACKTCMLAQCNAECATCSANPECGVLYDCILGCATSTCESQCLSAHAAGYDDLMAFLGTQNGCMNGCASQCGQGSSSGPDGGTSTGGGSSSDEAYCIEVVNAIRSQHGVREATVSATIQEYSHKAAEYDAAHGDHSYHAATGSWYSEIEIPGYSGGVRQVIDYGLNQMWGFGPGEPHHDILADSGLTKAGCGVFATGGRVWVTVDFYY
jgi:hypothetical protein